MIGDYGETCKTCNFFDGHEVVGLCRLRAPLVGVEGEDGPVDQWPTVRETDWCGEYVARPWRAGDPF